MSENSTTEKRKPGRPRKERPAVPEVKPQTPPVQRPGGWIPVNPEPVQQPPQPPEEPLPAAQADPVPVSTGESTILLPGDPPKVQPAPEEPKRETTAAAQEIFIIAAKFEGEQGVKVLGKDNRPDGPDNRYVGWIDKADWMKYRIRIPTGGMYRVSLMVKTSSPRATAQVRDKENKVLAQLYFDNTGGEWQEFDEKIRLSGGMQLLFIQSGALDGFDFKSIRLNYIK